MFVVKALFTSTAGAGHLLPLVPVARAAAKAGWTVTLAAPAETEALALSAGLPFAPLASSPDHAERRAVFDGLFELPVGQRNYRVCREIFGRLNTRDTLADVQSLVDTFQPDVVVAEAGECSGGLIAEVIGLPHVRIHPGLSTLPFFDAALAEGLREHRQKLGLEPVAGEAVLRAAPQVGYFPRQLEFDSPDAADVLRIRDPRYAVDANRVEPDLVYLTLGSEAAALPFFAEVMQAAIDGIAQAGFRGIVSLGQKGDPRVFRVPEGIELHYWVDPSDVLARSSVVVCHGGSGSVLAALSAGRPLVIIPLFADQQQNADRVSATGAGLTVAAGPALADRLADALLAIRTEGSPGTDRVHRAIAALPGPQAAVQLLARLAHTRVNRTSAMTRPDLRS